MRLICFWCVIGAVFAQEYYAPQTFKVDKLFDPEHLPWNSALRKANEAGPYYREVFQRDTSTAGSVAQPWKPAPEGPSYEDYPERYRAPPAKAEQWRMPYGVAKEQQASILHHKQSLSSDGAFRFEYASDNGLAAGEQIEPDGSRVGAYQYKDPSGQLVKLKYRAGKEGFQILEGSHVPKSQMPSTPQSSDSYYEPAYEQRREYTPQYSQQRPEPNQGPIEPRGAGGQYLAQSWRPEGPSDGQYRENDVEPNRGPHSFGEGYAFAFQGKQNNYQ